MQNWIVLRSLSRITFSRTYVLSAQWNRHTEQRALQALAIISPAHGEVGTCEAAERRIIKASAVKNFPLSASSVLLFKSLQRLQVVLLFATVQNKSPWNRKLAHFPLPSAHSNKECITALIYALIIED